ncbi:MAG: hypothetical protein CMN30_17085 [Sandaracinus sp.]|nr:hypothetical protein [Sandaracinus sp.]|tara:strand:- start:1326 stop:2036 length:711 start_codon:yes stop_codon:yes gene_type:complete
MEHLAAVRDEVHVVREVLEGAFAPEVATTLMFRALRDHGAVPASREDVLELCRTTLVQVVADRAGPEVARMVLGRMEQVLLRNDRTGTDIPIEVDLDDSSITLVMPTVWRTPVSTVVVSAHRLFADQLYGCLGEARVLAITASEEKALQKVIFSHEPLFVIVDATDPPEVDRASLVTALQRLPDSVQAVVWGAEHDYADGFLEVCHARGVEAVGVDQAEGIGPLLDLILARYQGGL